MRNPIVSVCCIALVTTAMVSCRSEFQLPSITPASPVVAYAGADAPTVAVPVKNRTHAISYCRGRLNALVPSFSIITTNHDVAAEMSAIAHDLLDSGLAVAMEMEASGNRITFTPEYSDCVLMLRAHREPGYRKTLASRTQQALLRAEQIVADVCAQYASSYDRAVALHDYIALNTRYESRLGIAAQADATTRLLLEGVAVCDGYAHAYGLLLSMAGIENRYVVGVGDGVEHIWNLVYLDGRWTHVDVTYDDPKPDKPGRILHSYFGMSDARIATNHKWNRAEFPRASTDALYHPIRKGHRFATVHELLRWADAQRVGHPWNVTVYVDELNRVRTESATHAKFESAANALGSDNLRSVAIDKGCRGAVYCSFEY